MRIIVLLSLVVPGVLSAQAPLPLKHAAERTHPAITPGDLMTRAYILADDSMMGRETGTEGNVKATAYIGAELQRMGLEPGGDSGTFFQYIPLYNYRVPDQALLALNGQSLDHGTDYLLFIPGVPDPARMRSLDGVEVVWGGVVGDTARMIGADQADGRLVVLAVPRRPDGSLRLISPAVAGRMPQFHGAAGLALVELDALPASVVDALRGPQPVLLRADPAESATPILLSQAAAERAFGVALDSLAPGTLAGAARASDLVVAENAVARNVIGILRGSDPSLRGQVVAMGAHSDHDGLLATAVDHDSVRAYNTEIERLGLRGPARGSGATQVDSIRINVDSLRLLRPARADTVLNGADDDGSGSSSLLEIAEEFATARQKPRRTMLFIWHTGEEKGLWGSDWHSRHTALPRDSIVAYLNMDMVGRGAVGDIAGGGPDYLQLIGPRRLSAELGDIIEAVNQASRAPMRLDYSFDADGHPFNRYCRSDHANYARYGIPVTQFSTGYHIDYHQPTDEPQYLDYPHMARVAQLIHDVAERVANLDHRLVVDKPKPDPAAPCRQ